MTKNQKSALVLLLIAVVVFLSYQAGYDMGKDFALRDNAALEAN